jgi:hypothetical protein
MSNGMVHARQAISSLALRASARVAIAQDDERDSVMLTKGKHLAKPKADMSIGMVHTRKKETFVIAQ